MSLFTDRERGFEAKFAYDEDRRLLALARRNHLAALWAAETLGKAPEEREAYAKEIVRVGVSEADDNAAAARIRSDLAAAGVAISETELGERMNRFLAAAEQQLRIEDLTMPEYAPAEQ